MHSGFWALLPLPDPRTYSLGQHHPVHFPRWELDPLLKQPLLDSARVIRNPFLTLTPKEKPRPSSPGSFPTTPRLAEAE